MREAIKLIFLDIDGVLNTPDHTQYVNDKFNVFMEAFPQFVDDASLLYQVYANLICEDKVKILNDIVALTGSKVILSSAWRKSHSISDINAYFKCAGYQHSIDAITPTISTLTSKRGDEIEAFITNYPNPIESYVIIDDIDEVLDNQRNNFVLVDYTTGLTEKDADRAISILGKRRVFDEFEIVL